MNKGYLDSDNQELVMVCDNIVALVEYIVNKEGRVQA